MMIPDSHLLEQLWLGTLTHLWQTTLVLLPLFVLARAMRNAPARLVNVLWSIGLAKLFVPLVIIVPVARKVLLPLLERVMPLGFGTGAASVWLGRASAVLDPAVLSVSGRSVDHGFPLGLFQILTLAWAGGAAYLAFRWVRGRWTSSPAVSDLVLVADVGSRSCLESALEGTGVSPDIICVVPGAAMPAVTGLLRRRIVVSETMIRELTTAELRAVLLHENEHRRRFDPMRSVIHRFALAVFFYYPLLWMVLRRLNSSCEIACDEAALCAGVQPIAYARALARTLNLGLLPSASHVCFSLRSHSLIHQRLNRLTQDRRYTAMMSHRIAIAAAVVFVVALSLLPLPPLAGTEDADQQAQEVPPPPRPPETQTVDKAVPPPPPPPELPGEEPVQPPRLIPESYVRPEYPEVARKAGIQGEVILDVTVNEDGTVGATAVKQGIPESPWLDESAEAAIRQWLFEPATKAGKPVKMTIGVPVRFRLDDKDKALDADTMPELVSESIIKPEYPEDARKAGISGKVILDVVVRTDGTPGTISVKEGIADYPSLAEKAIEAVSQWKFRPATKDGKPIESTVVIPVMFRLDSSDNPK